MGLSNQAYRTGGGGDSSIPPRCAGRCRDSASRNATCGPNDKNIYDVNITQRLRLQVFFVKCSTIDLLGARLVDEMPIPVTY